LLFLLLFFTAFSTLTFFFFFPFPPKAEAEEEKEEDPNAVEFAFAIKTYVCITVLLNMFLDKFKDAKIDIDDNKLRFRLVSR